VLVALGIGTRALATHLVERGCRALTTVRWPLRDLAHRGVQMLVRTIDDADAEQPRQVLTTELVIREST
jgi:DNA-binding LacI/PurR family transcriptional regulator